MALPVGFITDNFKSLYLVNARDYYGGSNVVSEATTILIPPKPKLNDPSNAIVGYDNLKELSNQATGGIMIDSGNNLRLINGNEFRKAFEENRPLMQLPWIITHDNWWIMQDDLLEGGQSDDRPLRDMFTTLTLIVDPGRQGFPMEIWITGETEERQGPYGVMVDYILNVQYPEDVFPDLKIGHFDQGLPTPVSFIIDDKEAGFGPLGEYTVKDPAYTQCSYCINKVVNGKIHEGYHGYKTNFVLMMY